MDDTKIDLASMKCKPCHTGTPLISEIEAKTLIKQLKGWNMYGNKITKQFQFIDFNESMEFVNKVADLAEEQGHHPDIYIRWNKVTLTILTYVIHGLSENDFILAAKIDRIR